MPPYSMLTQLYYGSTVQYLSFDRPLYSLSHCKDRIFYVLHAQVTSDADAPQNVLIRFCHTFREVGVEQ